MCVICYSRGRGSGVDNYDIIAPYISCLRLNPVLKFSSIIILMSYFSDMVAISGYSSLSLLVASSKSSLQEESDAKSLKSTHFSNELVFSVSYSHDLPLYER